MQSNNKLFIGIDVSKDTLDICFNNNHYKIDNSSKAISNFIKLEIADQKKNIQLCVLESTGGYEKLAMKLLQQTGIMVHRAHPNRIHFFAKTVNHFAKTDKLDSILLAKYAQFIAPEQKGDVSISEVSEELKELKSIELDLEINIQANKNRLHHLGKTSAAYVKKQISFEKKQLEKIRSDIDNKITEDDELSKKQKIMTSYKGIGKKTASVLLINLPELGKIGNKQITSLVGLAPKTNQSGKKTNKAHITGGRFFVRKALYMAALVATRYNKNIIDFYKRLIDNGKAPKVALTAVMRKIIICINSMIKNNSLFA